MLILQNQDTHMLFYKSKIYITKLNLFPDCYLPACDLTKCQSILQNYYFFLMILVKVQIMQNAKKNQESLTRIHEDAFSECTNPKTYTHTLQNFGKPGSNPSFMKNSFEVGYVHFTHYHNSNRKLRFEK